VDEKQELRAFISPMYELIKQKKVRRNDFLKSLVNLFDFPKDKSFQREISFYQFIIENLAYLNYTTQDEVLHVVYYINLILSITGEDVKIQLDGFDSLETPSADLVIRSFAFSLLITLRNFLKCRFGLSERFLPNII
jgi:hypothetical protein